MKTPSKFAVDAAISLSKDFGRSIETKAKLIDQSFEPLRQSHEKLVKVAEAILRTQRVGGRHLENCGWITGDNNNQCDCGWNDFIEGFNNANRLARESLSEAQKLIEVRSQKYDSERS